MPEVSEAKFAIKVAEFVKGFVKGKLLEKGYRF